MAASFKITPKQYEALVENFIDNPTLAEYAVEAASAPDEFEIPVGFDPERPAQIEATEIVGLTVWWAEDFLSRLDIIVDAYYQSAGYNRALWNLIRNLKSWVEEQGEEDELTT